MKLGSQSLRRALLGFFAIFCLISLRTSLADEACPNGPLTEDKYCRFFVYYEKNENKKLDPRVADALGVEKSSQTRAIGLVIAISKYPNMDSVNLPAAETDGRRLVQFLIVSQKFDEVILLADEDANQENLTYFLEYYLVNRANNFNGKARLLIAYSGHGRSPTPDVLPAFVLSNAEDYEKPAGMYAMSRLTNHLFKLSTKYFHVLTLVNACFGGGVFTIANAGGNADAFTKPGSYAITAGDEANEVFSLNHTRGSVFFDNIITGVSRGDADLDKSGSYRRQTGEGEIIRTGYTRTMMLASYLTRVFENVNKDLKKDKKTLQISEPWFGPAQKEYARGGFFFLSDMDGYTSQSIPYDAPLKTPTVTLNPIPPSVPSVPGNQWPINTGEGDMIRPPRPLQDIQIASGNPGLLGGLHAGINHTSFGIHPSFKPTPRFNLPPIPKKIILDLEPRIEFPIGPISSIPGRPDIKIFKDPEVYPIHGYDISSADGKINWVKFLDKEEKPRFIYARAVGWRGVDSSFKASFEKIRAGGVDYGAYFKYDFCHTPDYQFKNAKSLVVQDTSMLPVAILLVNPQGENEKQLGCFNQSGLEQVKNDILKFATLVHEYYGKTPIFYGNHNNLSTFLDDRFNKYMVWLGYWGKTNLKYGGSNPWTLWQHSGSLVVAGIGPKMAGEVFFGTEAQYEEFKAGKKNVALAAVK